MRYQDLDFKTLSPAATRRKPSPANLPRPRARWLLVGALPLIGLGLLAALTDGVAKVEDSTVKPERLHYSLELPGAEATTGALPSATPASSPAPAKTLPDDASKPEIQTEEARQADPIPEQPEPEVAAESTPAWERFAWKEIEVRSGDTLAAIFDRAGLKPSTTHEVANLNDQTRQLRRIRPGQKIALLIDDQQQLIQLKYMPSLTQTLVIKRQADQKLQSELLNHPLDAVPVFKSGVIESSLFEAAAVSGIPENIIMEMANIFGWDIDFALDIRKGDRFAVVYNELYKEGTRVRSGKILAAEFVNRGKVYRALYYTDPKGNSGYFTPDGKSMRKAFLRSPVKFSRISSRFTGKRWHPVLGKWRSHKGVDYAAARGTPVRASGDGKVIKAMRSKSYGNVVFLQHGGRYTTVYAHMKGFARGIRKGKRVKQGQVIGYVGSTGYATGPHLHYEFRVNGVHRNPLTIKLPAAAPINPAYREDFRKQTRSQLALLDLAREQLLARLDSNPSDQP